MATRATFQSLPPETLLHVFRHLPLQARNATLFNLAIVSRVIHSLAISALYDTVVLETMHAMQKFAQLAQEEPLPDVLRLVHNLSPWCDRSVLPPRKGTGGTSADDYDGEEIPCLGVIISRCPNVVNIQTHGEGLRYAGSAQQLDTIFVWMLNALTPPSSPLPCSTFAHVVRLHIADLQTIVSRTMQSPSTSNSTDSLPRISRLFTHQAFPRLRFFSSTWAPYQMFDEDHDALREVALAVLALPTLQRFVVRHIGLEMDLPTLEELHDSRILVLTFDPRHPLLSENLQVWTLSALGQLSMWTGKQIWRRGPLTPPAADIDLQDTALDVLLEDESEDTDDGDAASSSSALPSNLEGWSL